MYSVPVGLHTMKSIYPDFQWENSHEVIREHVVMEYTKSVMMYIVSENFWKIVISNGKTRINK